MRAAARARARDSRVVGISSAASSATQDGISVAKRIRITLKRGGFRGISPNPSHYMSGVYVSRSLVSLVCRRDPAPHHDPGRARASSVRRLPSEFPTTCFTIILRRRNPSTSIRDDNETRFSDSVFIPTLFYSLILIIQRPGNIKKHKHTSTVTHAHARPPQPSPLGVKCLKKPVQTERVYYARHATYTQKPLFNKILPQLNN